MSSSLSPAASTTSAIRTALGISGALSVVVGILILVWPGRTAEVAVGIVAVYVIVAGLIYAALGVFSRSLRTWGRIGHVALGALFVVAGIVSLANLAAATVWFASFLGILLGILWIIEGVVALSTLSGGTSRAWTVFFAALSILAGVILLFSPLYVAVLWVFIGAFVLALGVFQIVRAITFGKVR